MDEAFDPFRECPRVRSAKDSRYRAYGAKSANGLSFSADLGGTSSVGWIGNSGDFSPGSTIGPSMSGFLAFSRSMYDGGSRFLRFHMNRAKKTRPITAIVAEKMALVMTPLLVDILKSPDAARRAGFDWELSNWTGGGAVGEVDKEEGIKEGDGVDDIEVGRGVDVGNIVSLITEV